MTGAGILSWKGTEGPAGWRLESNTLLVTFEGGTPLAFRLGELSGIAGDGHRIELRSSGETLVLSRLGGGGPSLLEELRRRWPPLRAAALRLTGSGTALRFGGRLARGGDASPAAFLLYDDLLLAAAEGGDLEPLFPGRVAAVSWDETAWTVTCRTWDGPPWVFGGLGPRSEEFRRALESRRAALIGATAELLARRLPVVDPAGRAALSGEWLPGRFVPLEELERLCPGFTVAWETAWLRSCPRAGEAAVLRRMADPGGVWLAHGTRDADGENEGVPAPVTADSGEKTPGVKLPGEPATTSVEGNEEALWMLVRSGENWFLELLSAGDYATYRFRAGGGFWQLAELLVAAPQFSRQALYLPIEDLAGDRADLAPAARDLPGLAELRSRLFGRVIHASAAAWEGKLLS